MADWDRESPSGTAVRDYGDPPIIDANGVPWTISRSGQVIIDGNTDTHTHGVIEIQYINRRVWMWTDVRLWWYKTAPTASWLPPDGTPYAPYGPFPDPRIDALQTAIEMLSAKLSLSDGTLLAQYEAIQEATAANEMRIDALVGGMTAVTESLMTIIKLLQDHPPPPAKPRIVGHMERATHEGTQPVPGH